VRWDIPESVEIGEYENMNIDGVTAYVHKAVSYRTNARIDAVTGGFGTKLIFLGFARK